MLKPLSVAMIFSVTVLAGAGPALDERANANLIWYESHRAVTKLHLDDAEVILEARVVSVELPHSILRSAGDWLWVATGHRFGLPEATAFAIQLSDVVMHRGTIPATHVLLQPMPHLVLDGPGMAMSGHRYLFFCRGPRERATVSWFIELDSLPSPTE